MSISITVYSFLFFKIHFVSFRFVINVNVSVIKCPSLFRLVVIVKTVTVTTVSVTLLELVVPAVKVNMEHHY